MLVTVITKNLPNGTEKDMLKPGHDMSSFVSKNILFDRMILNMGKTYSFETTLDIP